MEVNEAVRSYSVRESCSLNQAVLETLKQGAGLTGEAVIYTDLDFMANTWVADQACDDALAQFDSVDEGLWE